MAGKRYQSIDFDLKLNDYRKLLVLVKDVLDENDDVELEKQSDDFDGSLGTHLHVISEWNYENAINNESNECKYCEFLNLLKTNYTKIDVKHERDVLKLSQQHQSSTGNQREKSEKRPIVHLRYKTTSYPLQALEWSEFEPFRGVYGFVGFAVCNNLEDLLKAVKKFNSTKASYKKTLVESKLFIVIGNRSEFTSNLIANAINYQNGETPYEPDTPLLMPKSLLRQKSFDTDSVNNMDDDESRLNSKRSSIDFRVNDNESLSISTSHQISVDNDSELISDTLESISSIIHSENSTATLTNLSLNSDQISIDNVSLERELNEELKKLENGVVYLDPDFYHKNQTKERGSKIKNSVIEIVNHVYTKLSKLIDVVNASDEKQINYYSDYLKAPPERQMPYEQQTNFSIQLKVINKKKVAGRMNKYRGDLCLLLNLVEHAFYNYFKAANILKKEQDYMWVASATMGLCVTSCYYANEHHAPHVSASVPANLFTISDEPIKTNNENVAAESKSGKSLQQLKSSFKRKFTTPNKDLQEFLIKADELFEQFQEVLGPYSRNYEYAFLEFELNMIMAKYFIEKGLPKNETAYFINNSIYITNLNIKEESRIRRYLEIAKIYEYCGKKRVCSFYKWISAGRIFRLIHQITDVKANESPRLKEFKNFNLKRILNKCLQQNLSIFGDLRIRNQLKPREKALSNVEMSFPSIKRRLLAECIQLHHFINSIKDCIKLTRYLMHEMYPTLRKEEMTHFSAFLSSIDMSKYNFEFSEPFYTQFYNFPILNAVKINATKDNTIARLPKSEDQTNNRDDSRNIYIHRYENPLLTGRKKTVYTFTSDVPTSIQMSFKNPLTFGIPVNKIYLLTSNDAISNSGQISSTEFTLNIVDFQPFSVPASVEDYLVTLNVIAKQIGTVKIIGYLIDSFNSYSKILFDDLVNSNESKYVDVMTTIKTEPISTTYEIEVVPILPTVGKLQLKCQNNEDAPVIELTNDQSTPILDCYTGETKLYDLFIDAKEFEIVDANIYFTNQYECGQNTAQLLKSQNESTKTITKLQIEANSNNFFDFLNTTSNEANKLSNDNSSTVYLPRVTSTLACTFEFKLTNNTAKKLDYCRSIKQTFSIKFIQLVNLTRVNIADVSEKVFEMDLTYRNSHNADIQIEYPDETETCASKRKCSILPANSETTVKVLSKKLNINLLNVTADINDKLYSRLLNNQLNLKFSYDGKNFTRVNFNYEYYQLNKYYKLLYETPFEILITNSSHIESQKLAHIGLKFTSDLKSEKDIKLFNLDICNKLKYCLMNGSMKTLKCFEKDQFYFETLRFFNRNNDKIMSLNNVKLTFNLKASNISLELKWHYVFDFDNSKFTYIAN